MAKVELDGEEAVVLKCKACFENKVPFRGLDAYATKTHVLLHCRTCREFIAAVAQLEGALECDLCKAGVDHEHEDHSLPRQPEVPEVEVV
jgi:hypothetical protein